ncbi:4-hydroxy-tetrahydrodipicolinate reductase [Marinicauda salina]|uniref:4-hydroxy-tetrahydrodipicolinate reductase n=1 Tax=Marinicauda salina TaxID=2135793 RepID=A0A2U2BWI5_9PROT|nr:4-hydroxy-tetrahydrodipicolinate reductase [Marinicauda salina]PWE18383.1 4-hydroxy-tetrahydrodipicolinate reductase [Marinicauda salina]
MAQSAQTLNIAVIGASGRLGRLVLAEAIRRPGLRLVGGMVSSDSINLDADLGELAGLSYLGLSTVSALEEAIDGADIVIDVSAPKVTAAIAGRLAAGGGPALVTGVTGLDAGQRDTLRAASEHMAVLHARNFSLGVAVMERLVGEAAAALKADQFDLEIVETHHKRKADAPSGTALTLGEAAAAGRGEPFDSVARFEPPHGDGRGPIGTIGFAAVRGGGVVGEHAVRFLGAMEEVAISHRAFDRAIFAKGAIEAALWLRGKPAGFYTMADVAGG